MRKLHKTGIAYQRPKHIFIYVEPLPLQNDTEYNHGVCQRLAHVMMLYTSLAKNNPITQNNPVNIDRNDLTKYQCSEAYIPGLQNTNLIEKYFPVENDKIDWNALLHVDNETSAEMNLLEVRI